ncbi:LysR family transcriptional regulator [Sphingomonas sp. PR090111-T3T-6A]|uniref:LysR family transcriptional regulator n=1 Tax=Sphingomonas sp. PR090111-T3T-6A TaxID=685778 RepID=UPI0003745EF0|nr:LysR family transcriptional regulator [Sphingomonas sp. PR090111-T3T-6A]
MIDRYLLRYFLSVIDQGNFSKAAAACNVSQPTLSVGIAKLEREMGRALFHRTNKRVELTEAGARFAVHARRIEAEFAIAEREVQDTAEQATVRLGLLPTLPGAWIEAFLTRLDPAEERVELIEGRERDLLERLARGRIDVALSLIRRDQSRFASEPLFREGYALALPAGHRLASRATIAAEELAEETMIVRRQCEALADTSRHFTARGVRPFFAARTTGDERALALVRAGLGVTVMPEGFQAPGVARPRLADFTQEREIGLIYAPHADPARLRGGAVLGALTAALEAARTG